MQIRYTCGARSLINNHILKEALSPFTGGALVALQTTLRCKNPRYRKITLTIAREAPPCRASANVKFHCCCFKNSVSTPAQWLSGARGTTFGIPQYGADDGDPLGRAGPMSLRRAALAAQVGAYVRDMRGVAPQDSPRRRGVQTS
jgi:hypothetical protein